MLSFIRACVQILGSTLNQQLKLSVTESVADDRVSMIGCYLSHSGERANHWQAYFGQLSLWLHCSDSINNLPFSFCHITNAVIPLVVTCDVILCSLDILYLW